MRRRSRAAFCIRFSTKPSWLPRRTRLVSGSSMERVGNCLTSMRMPPQKPSTTRRVLPENTPSTASSLLRQTAASQAVTQRLRNASNVGMAVKSGRDSHWAIMRSKMFSWA